MWSKLLTAFLLCASARADFLGAQSCGTSGCHGGAKRDEFITWSKKDFHSRSDATLTTARSARIAETLHIADPATASRCIVCHAPMPEPHRAEGVSCETCHGAAENYLRSHTRPDYTHAERVQAGMRELKDLTARANACIACHQNVDADILAAGHPELIFELDGQSVAMPKHWRESSSPEAWLAGQTAALRELKWQLSREANEKLAARVAGLDWLLQKCAGPGPLLPRLAGTSADFEDASIPQAIQARRAERLVLALDRLSPGADLNELFKLAQSLPDFDPKKFAAALRRFQTHN